MRVAVTGAAGFIGANLLRALNRWGISDIIAVDHLGKDDKFRNLIGCQISDYLDSGQFLQAIEQNALPEISLILHQGACSDTTLDDGQYMMANNYGYTRTLFEWCQRQRVRLIYASSAAIYGQGGDGFAVAPECEQPLNLYGYSKYLFDQILRQAIAQNRLNTQVVGLRYFNVYGPYEQHKGRMASVAWHHLNQYHNHGFVHLFDGYNGYAAGEQQRDFVYVDDVVNVCKFFLENADQSGVFNLGTGRAQSFNEVACAVLSASGQTPAAGDVALAYYQAQKLIRYLPFPEKLKGKYQCYTQADVEGLRAVGYDAPFMSVAEGVGRYADWFASRAGGLRYRDDAFLSQKSA